MSNIFSFSLNVSGLCRVPHLKKAQHPINQCLHSIHHNLCLLTYLLNVLLLQNVSSMRVSLSGFLLEPQWPSSRCIQHIIASDSCPLPLEVWRPHSPAGLPVVYRNKHPTPRFHPVFTAPFPILTSHIFQEALFGWAPG